MTLNPDIVVFDDPAALASGAADRIASFIKHHASDTVTVGMAGGSTPAATYGQLRHLDIPWDRVYAWVGDERFVPPEHPDNNGTMARRSLLDDTAATFFGVPWWEGATPAELAAVYERSLLEIMDHDEGGPLPDLLLAGIGDDGHTLSLFPGTSALDNHDRWFVENEVPQHDTWRLTTTFGLARRARQTYVLVAGAGKAQVLAEIMDPTSNLELPARRLMEHDAEVTWLIDRAAASLLKELS